MDRGRISGAFLPLTANAQTRGGSVLRTTRFRPSPAMVIACVALLAALTGTGVAAVNALAPRDSVASAQVVDRSLQKVDFKAGALPAGPRGARGAAGARGPQG